MDTSNMSPNDVLTKLEQIQSRLDHIEALLQDINRSNTKMHDHINFVEAVFQNVKNPFFKIMNYAGFMLKDVPDKNKQLEH